jgi:hypothetical protein
MVPLAGEVYYGTHYFPDGGSFTKFALILHANPSTGKVIVCIATKVAVDKNKNPGCHVKTQRFFIPAHQEFFEVDTYFELLRISEFPYVDFTKNTLLRFQFALTPDTLTKIRECLKKLVDDIAPDLFPLITQ